MENGSLAEVGTATTAYVQCDNVVSANWNSNCDAIHENGSTGITDTRYTVVLKLCPPFPSMQLVIAPVLTSLLHQSPHLRSATAEEVVSTMPLPPSIQVATRRQRLGHRLLLASEPLETLSPISYRMPPSSVSLSSTAYKGFSPYMLTTSCHSLSSLFNSPLSGSRQFVAPVHANVHNH